MVKAISFSKGCKEKALCKDGDEGGLGSVLISERNLVYMYFQGGTKLG